MLDFGEALAAQRAKRPVKKAAEKRERYQAALSDLPLFQGVITETAVDPHTVAASPAAYAQLTELLRERGVITSADAQALLGLDAVAVRSLLKQLVDEGLAVVEGEKRGTRYRRL
jgi:Fic family protein